MGNKMLQRRCCRQSRLPTTFKEHSIAHLRGSIAVAWTDHERLARSQDTAGVDKSLSSAAESGDPEAVFKVIEEHGQEFSESNVTNSFAALAQVADGKGLDEAAVHGHRSFQTLVGESSWAGRDPLKRHPAHIRS